MRGTRLIPALGCMVLGTLLAQASGCGGGRQGAGDASTDDAADDCNEDAPHQFMGVDILVVVDNSPGMAEEQASLTSAFPALIESLLDPVDDAHLRVPDLHIGVISTDMGTGGYTVETCRDPIDGDNGELQHSPSPSVSGCESAYPTYLSYDRYCAPDPAAIDSMSTSFGCLAPLGTDGCGWEQPLEAAARALIDHRDGINAGFLRPDSVLVILFVTDEDDCSVIPGREGIFDTLDSSLGHMNLRCMNHPDMVEAVGTYVTAFASLRTDPDRLLLAFLVGVPRGSACEGFGYEIADCLDEPDMQERVDPESTTDLAASCGSSSSGEAYPPRRLVQVAQGFGDRALVQSICTNDFEPAVENLAARVHGVFDGMTAMRSLPTAKDEEDPCRCVTECSIIEALSDLRSCDTADKPCYMPEGPGTPCADPEEDPDGLLHTLCEIPQAGTRMTVCDSSWAPEDTPGCDDPGVTHLVDGEGWYYMDRNWEETGTGVIYSEPQILFTEGMEPEEGSNVYIQCDSFICPENRQCGPEDDRDSVCCTFDEFCARGEIAETMCAPGEAYCCVLRPD